MLDLCECPSLLFRCSLPVFDDWSPVRAHSQRHRSRCRSGRGALRGSGGHGGPLVRPQSVDLDNYYPEEDGGGFDLDEGDGEVVRGGVEPLDGGDHAAVIDCA